MTLEELQAEVTRLGKELEASTTNANKLVKEKREALTRAEKAEADAADAAETAKAESGTELQQAQSRITKLEKDLKNANDLATQSNKFLRDYKRDAEIATIITANKVNPDDARAVKAMLLMELDSEGDEPTINGEALADYAKSYFAKEGLRYVMAADHNGGGATGNSSTATNKITLTKRPSTPAEWDELDRLSDEDRNAFCDRINAPDLKV